MKTCVFTPPHEIHAGRASHAIESGHEGRQPEDLFN
jgi:hypothetical protein